jgi:AAA+ superfamily predicted ATPase
MLVFLRKLEYYKGILILTTNLIDCIDDAFESRISYPIRFRELSRDDRHQIWTDFIKAMNMLPAYKAKLMSEVDRWSEAEINGRQIRNIILLAENLASSDEKHPRLMPHHVDELLNVTIEFCDYNQNNATRVKKIQLTSGISY